MLYFLIETSRFCVTGPLASSNFSSNFKESSCVDIALISLTCGAEVGFVIIGLESNHRFCHITNLDLKIMSFFIFSSVFQRICQTWNLWALYWILLSELRFQYPIHEMPTLAYHGVSLWLQVDSGAVYNTVQAQCVAVQGLYRYWMFFYLIDLSTTSPCDHHWYILWSFLLP